MNEPVDASHDASSAESSPGDDQKRAAAQRGDERESPPSQLEGEVAITGSSVSGAGGGEDLPHWEPLTPELVEDEAIRGDFMLRWAVILLALLMGWTIVQDTSVLTHVKAGQAIAANGYWPPVNDSLSAVGERLRWVNLSWMWDLLVAGVHGLAGDGGLTVLKALLAALVFWLLSLISLPGVPTWWGSVCAALALIAAFPALTATPGLVSLLGTVCLLLIVQRWLLRPQDRSLWPVVLLLMTWSQFDERAWMGLALLLAVAAGHGIDCRRNTLQVAASDARTPAVMTALAAVAMLIHPFLWETLLSPVGLYRDEYPALRIYAHSDLPFLYERYPVWASEFWENLGYFNGTALLLWLIAITALFLNRRRVRFSHLALFVAATALAAVGSRELALAGIVNAVLATLNAQQWYQANFRQSYSVETRELVFSRGGRAVTVLALFGLGFAMVGGHLTGADGRRVGMGLDRQLQQTIASYRSVLEDSFDERPFNLRLEQGDMLIWIGERPFIDSRVRLFANPQASMVEEHLKLRSSLRQPQTPPPLTAEPRDADGDFSTYGITHVVPRLSGETPDYRTFHDLIVSDDWLLIKLGAATAVFYRTTASAGDLASYIAEHKAPGLVERVLRTRDDEQIVTAQRSTWPQPPTLYERLFYRPHLVTPNALQRARHYSVFLQGNAQSMTIDEAVAAACATIRDVHTGLAEAPAHRDAYHLLGQAYSILWDVERDRMQRAGLTYPGIMRYLQTSAAYHHALLCDPSDPVANFQLFRVYASQGRQDLALRHLQQMQALAGSLTLTPPSHPQYAAQQQQAEELLQNLVTATTEIQKNLAADLAAGADRLTMAQSLEQAGFPLTALETLDEDLTVLSGKPEAALLYGHLLLEAGRTSEAFDQLQGVRRLAEQGQLIEWPTMASISEVVAEDLPAALHTLQEEHQRFAKVSVAMMLEGGPLQAGGSGLDTSAFEKGGEDTPPFAIVSLARRLQMAGVYFEQLLPRMEANQMRRALLHLELGQNGDAAQLFHDMLQQSPTSSLRPIAQFYLTLLSATPDIPPLPPQAELDSEVPALPEEPAGTKPQR